MFDAAQRRECSLSTLNVFAHVWKVAKETHDPLYLPYHRIDPAAYKQLWYLRQKHKCGELRAADYHLLARLPRILGSAVYGAVQGCAGGYRWTFAPAGVDVQGDVFPTKAAAAGDHLPLRQALYPGWEDPGQRAAHLQRLLSLRAQEQRVPGLAVTRRLRRLRTTRRDAKTVRDAVNDHATAPLIETTPTEAALHAAHTDHALVNQGANDLDATPGVAEPAGVPEESPSVEG